MGDLGGSIQQAWTGFLDLVGKVVGPDWNSLVLLIPLGIAGLLALYLLGTGGIWTLAALTRRRPRIRYEQGPRPMAIGPGGTPEVPLGLPFSRRTSLVYPFGTQRDDAGDELSVVCPTCRLERPASIAACGNCGLRLSMTRRVEIAGPPGPPPGGAAAA